MQEWQQTTNTIIGKVGIRESGMRLDKFLSNPLISRSRAQSLIKSGSVKEILSNSLVWKNDIIVKQGQIYELTIPIPKAFHLKPVAAALDIIFEDEDILVLNKSAGITVHPGAGTKDNTLVHYLLNHCPLAEIGGVIRPGIVHRLDKDTSGLMVVAKSDVAFHSLQQQLKDKTIQRKYLALVWGQVLIGGSLDNFLVKIDRIRYGVSKISAGKRAITNYRVVSNFDQATLLECSLNTGRTHQIRVHLNYMGNSIVGDKIYGKNQQKAKKYGFNIARQALHSYKLEFKHPINLSEMKFKIGLPEDIDCLIKNLSLIKVRL